MRSILRSVMGEPREPNPPGVMWRDRVVLAASIVSSLLEGFLRPDLPWRPVAIVLAVGLAPTLLWRRSHPLPMVALGFGSMIALDLIRLAVGGGVVALMSMVYLLILVYALFRWGSGREATIGISIVIVAATIGTVQEYTGVGDAIGGFAILFATAASGVAIRTRATNRRQETDQIKLIEREQLARELHDTVAHHVSAIAIQAQAGRATLHTNPNAAIEALEIIESEASRTLGEMRAMVRVLRDGGPPEFMPQPGVADIERMAHGAPDRLPVRVEMSGPIDRLPVAVSAAVYRLAQESITNARRHARSATRVDVCVAVDDTTVRLRVADDGDTRHLTRQATHPLGLPITPGYGLVGMAERARLLGGTCDARPCPDGGWVVDAVLPTDAPA